MTTPKNLVDLLMRSPIAAQLERADAEQQDATRRSYGETIAAAEHERDTKRPPIAAALDKLIAERATILEKLAAKNRAIVETRAALADVDNSTEHRIAVSRKALRETAPAAIGHARQRLDELEEATNRAGYDNDVKETDTMLGRRRELLATNYHTTQARLTAIFAARRALDALAERYVPADQVQAEIEAIFATIPDAKKETVKNAQPLAAA